MKSGSACRAGARWILVATLVSTATFGIQGAARATDYFTATSTGTFQMIDLFGMNFSFGTYYTNIVGACGACVTAADGAGKSLGSFGFSAQNVYHTIITDPPTGTTQSAIPGYGGDWEHFDGYGTFDIIAAPFGVGPALLNGSSNYYGYSLFGTPGSNRITIEFDLDEYANSDLIALPTGTPLYLDISASTAEPLTLTNLQHDPNKAAIWTFTTPITFDFDVVLTDISYKDSWNTSPPPPPTPSVPEPASWAMMIGGFALAGTAMRRRKATIRFA